jgi:hypothetical protein
MSDIAVALTGSIARDGQSAPTADLPMAGFKHTNVAPATALNEYARADQVQAGSLLRCTAEANTGDAYTGLLPFGATTFVSGQTITYKFPATNTTTTPTLSLNSSPAWPIRRQNGGAVLAGDCQSGIPSQLVWNDTAWLFSSGSGIAAGADTQVIFNDGGVAAGDAGLTYAKATDTLTTGVVLTGDGTLAAPAYSFTSDTSLGMYKSLPGIIDFVVSSAPRLRVHYSLLVLPPTNPLAWASDAAFTITDAGIGRNAAGVVEINNSQPGSLADLKLRAVYAGSGSAAAPAYSVGAANTGFYSAGAGYLDFALLGTARYQFNATGFLPYVDNSATLGYSAGRWSTVYAATGAINTSDIRLKKDVKDSRLGLAFIEALHPVSYRWITGSNKVVQEGEGEDLKTTTVAVPGVRTHWGLIAQDVKKAVDASGVEDFAGYVVDDMKDPDSYLSLRYEEFIAPLIKAVQELSAKVKTLEAQLAAKG